MGTLDLKHPSIADIAEEDLVEILVKRGEVFDVFGMPRDAAYKSRVLLNDAPGDFRSDIDVLLCNRERPGEAAAFEVKRIKFGLSAFKPDGSVVPNKLREVEKAIEQANRLAEVGFWKVFLYVVVVVDSRGRNAGAVTYAGLSSREKSMLEPYLSMDKLEPRVGFSLLDFTQPMDAIPLTVGTHGMHIRRMPTAQEQSAELTRWVSGVLRDEDFSTPTPSPQNARVPRT
jgi:hypothetical protein